MFTNRFIEISFFFVLEISYSYFVFAKYSVFLRIFFLIFSKKGYQLKDRLLPVFLHASLQSHFAEPLSTAFETNCWGIFYPYFHFFLRFSRFFVTAFLLSRNRMDLKRTSKRLRPIFSFTRNYSPRKSQIFDF